MKASKLFIAALLAVCVLIGGSWIYLVRPEHKYRLTIEVQTPDGVKSASGVMAVHMAKDGGILPGAGGSVGLKGDALFVDLGEGRNLIVALAHGVNASAYDGMSRLAMLAFAAAGQKVPFGDVSRLTGTVPVRGDLIPTLVTFADLGNPTSARVLDPADLESSFGRGVRLNRVLLEMVPIGLSPLDFGGPLGEPVTRRIELALPWIASVIDRARAGRASGFLNGRFACNPSAELCLSVGNFRRG